MPVYTDKRGRLFIQFQYKGYRHKERLPEGTKVKDAERLELKLKSDLMFQSHGITSGLTFDNFIKEYFGVIAETYSPARFERTAQVIKQAVPFFRGKAMRSIKAIDIERFKQSRINTPTQHNTPRKPATVEREMSILSSLFSLAVRNDVIDYNPCSRVKKLKFDNVQDKILRHEDEERLFANMHSEWARDVCRFALHTGLRQNDIMTLTRFQVDLDNNVITLVQGKTRRRVIVPINAIAREILERRINNPLIFASPVTGNEKGSVRHAIQRACKRIGISSLSIRDLRRTFATRLMEDGAADITAARMLGHTGTRMIPRYVRSIELMRKASDSLANRATIVPAPKLKAVK